MAAEKIWEKNLETKGQIRKILYQRRSVLSPEERQEKSQLIFQKLMQDADFLKAENILLYASYQSEVETISFVSPLWKQKKKIFFPKVTGEGEMDFFQVNSLEQLEAGYQGIVEPNVSKYNCISFESVFSQNHAENFCMIVPLVGFDANKNRLGYGKGFYDRFLQKYPKVPTIGLAFACQQWEALPCEDTDQKLGKIITETQIYI